MCSSASTAMPPPWLFSPFSPFGRSALRLRSRAGRVPDVSFSSGGARACARPRTTRAVLPGPHPLRVAWRRGRCARKTAKRLETSQHGPGGPSVTIPARWGGGPAA
jgi:hypothetical protein